MSETRRTSGTTAWQPSRRALATRSLTRALLLNGEAKREALAEHFEQFRPAMTSRRSCPVTRF